MKRSTSTKEQIIDVLREQETGATTADLCRLQGISGATSYAGNVNRTAIGTPDRRAKGTPRQRG